MHSQEIRQAKHSLYLYSRKSPSISQLKELLMHRQHYQIDLQIILVNPITNHKKLKLLEKIIKLGSDVYYQPEDFQTPFKSFLITDLSKSLDLHSQLVNETEEITQNFLDRFYYLRANSKLISKDHFYKYPKISFYTSNTEVITGSSIEYFWKVEDLPPKTTTYLWVNNQPVSNSGTGTICVDYPQFLTLRLYAPNEFCFTRVLKIKNITAEPQISFYADRQVVFSNDKLATLYWQAELAEEIQLNGVGVVSKQGHKTIEVSADTSYTLTVKTRTGTIQKVVTLKYLDLKQSQFVNIHISAPLLTEPKSYPIANQLAKPNLQLIPAVDLANYPLGLKTLFTESQLTENSPRLSKLSLNINTSALFAQLNSEEKETQILNNSKEQENETN